VAFKWVNDSGTTSTGFFGYDDSTGYFTYVQTATITNEVVSGTKGAIDVNLAGGTAMSIVYQSSPNNTAFLAATTSGYILQTNGTGSPPTWVSASGVSAGSAANADNIRTIAQTANASYYPTFVDSNNASNAYELVYTTSSFSINPMTGKVIVTAPNIDGGLTLLSGASGSQTSFGVGRTAREASFAIAANGSDYMTGTAAGDAILMNRGGNLFLGMDGAYTVRVLTSNTERMRIASSGNVGIRITDPQNYEALTIAGSIRTTSDNSVIIAGNDGNLGFIKKSGFSAQIATNNAIDIQFVKLNTGTAITSQLVTDTTTTELMRITTAGGIAFSGSTNYGSSGQILKSNGNAAPTWVNGSTIGAGSVSTVAQTSNASYFPTFVDSNNASVADESLYTTSSFSINPQSGNVGIGIGAVAPSYKLQVGTAAATAASVLSALTPVLYVDGGSTANSSIVIKTHSGGSGTVHGAIRLAVSPDATNYSWSGMAGIADVNSAASTLAFYTAASNTQGTAAGASTERMRIDVNGNVGIGTTSSYTKLHVVGGHIITNVADTAATDSAADIENAGFGFKVALGTVLGALINTTANGNWGADINFNVRGSAGGVFPATPAMVVQSGGNVGVGTSSPAAKLHIVGSESRFGGVASGYISVYDNSGRVGYIQANGGTDLRVAAEGASTPMTFYVNSSERLRITVNGGIAFGGAANYGTSGQILQSNGDAAPTWIALSSRTVGTSTQVNTVLQTASASYFPTFVDSNNASATAEALYTTSSFVINPATGNVGFNKASPTESLYIERAGTQNLIFLNQSTSASAWVGMSIGYLGTEYFAAKGNVNTGEFQLGGKNASGYYTTIYSNNAETVRVTGGNVGIGTSSPGYPLVVQTNGTSSSPSPSGSNIALRLQSTQTNYAVGIQFSDNVTNATWITMQGGGFRFTTANPGAVQAMNISGSGNVSIGTTSTTNKFEVAGTAGQLFSVSDSFTGTIFSVNDISGIPSIEVLDTGLVKMAQYNGQLAIGTGTVASNTVTVSIYGMLQTMGTLGEIRASSEITAYYSSDRRLKENIKLIENPITIIDQIKGVTFDWTDEHMARRGGEDGYFVRKHDIGVIAQEVQAVLPELVGTREDGYLAVKYEKMVPLLIEAIKSQQKTIDSLVKDLADVKEFINQLKNNK
jgi:hypothetical protein